MILLTDIHASWLFENRFYDLPFYLVCGSVFPFFYICDISKTEGAKNEHHEDEILEFVKNFHDAYTC